MEVCEDSGAQNRVFSPVFANKPKKLRERTGKKKKKKVTMALAPTLTLTLRLEKQEQIHVAFVGLFLSFQCRNMVLSSQGPCHMLEG